MAGRNDQQGETLAFFSGFAAQWREKAEGQAAKVNVITQRNGAVLRVKEHLPRCRNALDLGCGTGELVIDLAQAGVDSVGIDFAPDMIAKCEEKKAQHRAIMAAFQCGSLFDYDTPPESFDLISGLGLIEYISAEELDRLIATATGWLRPGGALVQTSDDYWRTYATASRHDPPEVVFVKRMLQKGLPEGLRAELADDLFRTHVSADAPPGPWTAKALGGTGTTRQTAIAGAERRH